MAGATQHLYGKQRAYVLWGTVGREPESRKENRMTPEEYGNRSVKKSYKSPSSYFRLFSSTRGKYLERLIPRMGFL